MPEATMLRPHTEEEMKAGKRYLHGVDPGAGMA